MHALIVFAHPDASSLVHSIAAQLAQGISASGRHTYELADLAAEGFDPRFTPADLALSRREAPPPADVAAEQARMDRADAAVLVYPVYWWSMPALLKGWIDRVITNGWAYDSTPEAPLVKRLRGRQVHLVAVGGADAGTYARHGYTTAMRTQIEHGIFDYCGASVASSTFLLGAEPHEIAAHLQAAGALGRGLFDQERASCA